MIQLVVDARTPNSCLFVCLNVCSVAVVGNVDAGKSTTLGVLTHGDLDNGRGLARQRLFRHKHEIESGRTSSVANDIMGFDANGKVVNNPVHGKLDWSTICQNSSKVGFLQFILSYSVDFFMLDAYNRYSLLSKKMYDHLVLGKE